MKRVAAAFVLLSIFGTAAASARETRTPVFLKVMTRNLYLGANLDAIVGAKSPAEGFAAVEAAWAQVQANDFRIRARAIAREIGQTKPDVVGLQELALFRTQTPADFTVTPATTLALDYIAELRRALAARKLRYRFVVVGQATDAEFPSGNPASKDIRMTLRDALLLRVDRKVKVRRVAKGLYQANVPFFGGLIVAKRGWVSADLTIAKRTVHIVNTHLESFSNPAQVAQGQELAAGPARSRLPTILLGDFNSRADGSSTPTYANMLAAGYADAWPQARPGAVGLSCCHGNDLREAGGPFYSRIDLVLLRNGPRAVGAGIVGEEPRDRLNGLWPSDHAGVWARLRLP